MSHLKDNLNRYLTPPRYFYRLRPFLDLLSLRTIRPKNARAGVVGSFGRFYRERRPGEGKKRFHKNYATTIPVATELVILKFLRRKRFDKTVSFYNRF